MTFLNFEYYIWIFPKPNFSQNIKLFLTFKVDQLAFNWDWKIVDMLFMHQFFHSLYNNYILMIIITELILNKELVN